MQGCIILNSRYFSRRQDSELVAINLYVNVPFIGYFIAVYDACPEISLPMNEKKLERSLVSGQK